MNNTRLRQLIREAVLKENAKQVAGEIFRQLGGNKFKAMTGAYNMSYSNDGRGALSLKFKGSNKANYLKITLTSMDLYNMEFGKIRGHNYKVVKTYDGVYDDMLQKIFTNVTGLYTHL